MTPAIQEGSTWLRRFFKPRTDGRAEPDFTQEVLPQNVRLAVIEAELDVGIAQQRKLRLKRSAAAHKGHATRKARGRAL